MTPDAVAELSAEDITLMLDGIDWVNDREWERAMLPLLNQRAAKDLVTYSYPHFRKERITRIIHSDDPLEKEVDDG